MILTACGINHQTAPLDLRERLAIVPAELSQQLNLFVKETQVPEAAILSTCNRLELYCYTKDHESLSAWLCRVHQLKSTDLQPHFYVYQDEAAIRHMLRVSCGLDSMVLGEPQVLGQMKTAFQVANQVGTIGPFFQRLFQYIFSVTKDIRYQTKIGEHPISVAFAAIDLAKHIFTDLGKTKALVIGAGETIELILRYLATYQVRTIWLANRTFANAEKLAQRYAVKAIPFNEIPNCLPQADIVISATAAPLPIIGKGIVEQAIKLRKRKPVFMVDLAVPRDIEPEIATLPDVYLYCLDDLRGIIEDNLKDRKQAGQHAEELIEFHVERFMRWHQSFDAIKMIRNYRKKIEALREQEISKALQMLRLGLAPEEVIARLANNLTNKIMHSPTISLRQAGIKGQNEWLEVAKTLFEIEES